MSTIASIISLDTSYPHIQSSYVPTAISLPPEIMALIFSEACEVIPGNIRRRRQLHPFTLGGVCKGWREIAWSNSELWKSIDIHLGNGKCEEKHILVHEWISRAKGRDLDIFLEKLGDEECCKPIHVMDVLIQHRPQWRSLCLRLPNHWCNLLPLKGLASTVNLSGPTSLCLLDGEFNSRLILLSFPNLTKVHLSNVFPLNRHGMHFPVKLPRLHTLHVAFQYVVPCVNMLLSLNPPSLKRLQIEVFDRTDSSSSFMAGGIGKYLHKFFERSKCELTHLYLNFAIGDGITALINPISTQTVLEVLEINNRSDQAPITSGDSFFKALYPAGCSHRLVLVPHLRIFTYEGPLTKDHLETLLEIMILRTREDYLSGKLRTLRLRSTIPLGLEPSLPFESHLNLNYELRDSLAELVRCRVFELNICEG